MLYVSLKFDISIWTVHHPKARVIEKILLVECTLHHWSYLAIKSETQLFSLIPPIATQQTSCSWRNLQLKFISLVSYRMYHIISSCAQLQQRRAVIFYLWNTQLKFCVGISVARVSPFKDSLFDIRSILSILTYRIEKWNIKRSFN